MNFRRLLFVPLLVLSLFTSVLVGTSLAIDLGEPVEYDLTFPVDGPHHFLRHVLGEPITRLPPGPGHHR